MLHHLTSVTIFKDMCGGADGHGYTVYHILFYATTALFDLFMHIAFATSSFDAFYKAI